MKLVKIRKSVKKKLDLYKLGLRDKYNLGMFWIGELDLKESIIVRRNGSINSGKSSIVNGSVLIARIVITTFISNFFVIVDSVSLINPMLFWASNSPFSKLDWVCSVWFISCLSQRIVVVGSDHVLSKCNSLLD